MRKSNADVDDGRAAPYATLHTPADLLTQFAHTITLHQHYATIHVTQMHSGESWCVWDESWNVGRVMYDDGQTKQKRAKESGRSPLGTTRGLAASAIRGRRERWRQGLAHVNINIMPRANDQNDSSVTQNTQITQTACRLLRTFWPQAVTHILHSVGVSLCYTVRPNSLRKLRSRIRLHITRVMCKVKVLPCTDPLTPDPPSPRFQCSFEKGGAEASCTDLVSN